MDSKVCVVTGASSGIGEGVANSLVRAGFRKIAVVARRREKLEEVATECKAAGAEEVLVVAQDLSVLGNCPKVVQEVVDHFGRLDVLVMSAGIFDTTYLVDATVEQYQRLMNFNLISPFALTKAAIPHLRKAKGNVVFISDAAAENTFPGSGLYVSTKAALNSLAKTFALEEAKHEVRINLVSPGAILTDMLKDFVARTAGETMDDAKVKEYMSSQLQPLRRVGLPRHIGAAVAYLVDDAAAPFTTGTNLVVDGGAMLSFGPAEPDQKN